ncbi:MAG TPA: ankyrin repeat domain-containing protein [Candidatus Dormibacteraeota bacterium]
MNVPWRQAPTRCGGVVRRQNSLRPDQINFALLQQEQLAAGADPNLGDRQGFTPLHLAAQQWSVDVAKRLLDHGAEVDAENVFGSTPLFVAVFNSKGRGDLISLPRERGADPLKAN